jgi:hypothetical protein
MTVKAGEQQESDVQEDKSENRSFVERFVRKTFFIEYFCPNISNSNISIINSFIFKYFV